MKRDGNDGGKRQDMMTILVRIVDVTRLETSRWRKFTNLPSSLLFVPCIMEHPEIMSEPEAGPSTTSYSAAPVYAFDAAPRCVSSTSVSEEESEVQDNFFRSARW